MGRLRPSFFSRCDYDAVAKVCQGSFELVKDGRKSFPSGELSIFSLLSLPFLLPPLSTSPVSIPTPLSPSPPPPSSSPRSSTSFPAPFLPSLSTHSTKRAADKPLSIPGHSSTSFQGLFFLTLFLAGKNGMYPPLPSLLSLTNPPSLPLLS